MQVIYYQRINKDDHSWPRATSGCTISHVGNYIICYHQISRCYALSKCPKWQLAFNKECCIRSTLPAWVVLAKRMAYSAIHPTRTAGQPVSEHLFIGVFFTCGRDLSSLWQQAEKPMGKSARACEESPSSLGTKTDGSNSFCQSHTELFQQQVHQCFRGVFQLKKSKDYERRCMVSTTYHSSCSVVPRYLVRRWG